jgi:hypothetical protein
MKKNQKGQLNKKGGDDLGDRDRENTLGKDRLAVARKP